MVRVRCQCGKSLKMPPEHVNKRASCPQCGAHVRIVVAEQAAEEGKLKGRFTIGTGSAGTDELIFLGGRGPIEVGKAETAHLRLLSSAVSRRHCRLVQIDRGWRVEDQGSTNGLFVNNRRVKAHNLLHGDVLRVGDFELRYSFEPTRPADAFSSALDNAQSGADQPILTDEASALGLNFLDDTGALNTPALQARPAKPVAAAPAARAPATVTPQHPATRPPPPSDGEIFEFADDDDGGPPISLPVAPRSAVPDGEGPTCPSCRRILAPRAKICVQCGIDVKTGRRLITSRNTDDATAAAEAAIPVVSWIAWSGVYPVASEAYGGKKPHTVRAVALLTVLVSMWMLIAERKDSTAAREHKNLMLWPTEASLTAEHVELLYDYTDWGDSFAFHAALHQLEPGVGPAPESASSGDAPALPQKSHEENVLTAHASLTPDQQAVGRFHAYQLVTHAFLHGDEAHLLGNLLFLFVLGSRVNALIGNLLAAIVYPLLAIGAGIAHMLSMAGEPSAPMVGASGAVMGLAGMYFVLFPAHKVHMAVWIRWIIPPFPLSLWTFAVRGFWVVLFYIGFDVLWTSLGVDDGVAHWAHLGGFIVGFVIALVLLFTRLVDARGGDLLSVVLGRRAWALVGRPGHASAESA